MEFIEQLWREHTGNFHLWDGQLWLLLNFEQWHRMYLDQVMVPTLSPAQP